MDDSETLYKYLQDLSNTLVTTFDALQGLLNNSKRDNGNINKIEKQIIDIHKSLDAILNQIAIVDANEKSSNDSAAVVALNQAAFSNQLLYTKLLGNKE